MKFSEQRTTTQNQLLFGDDLIVDNFAGGGGASTGMEMVMGRPIDIAINHSAEALAMHAANHPSTKHYIEDVWKIDPRVVCGGRPVALGWFSPDCKHHSKARGGVPRDKGIRALAWVVKRWAATVRPSVMMLENVEEFRDWGPLTADNKPCPKRKGRTFQNWVKELRKLGYQVEWRELAACDYGAPTTRKRLFVIARCDGRPIVWPEPTHGAGLLPYRTAAEVIDWSLEIPSIFDRKKPLVENTLRRIAGGIEKYILNDPDPFLLNSNASPGELIAPVLSRIGQTGWAQNPSKRVDTPVTTILSKAEHILIAPRLVEHFDRRAGVRLDKLKRQKLTAANDDRYERDELVRHFLIKYFSCPSGQYQDINEPLHTIRTKDSFALIEIRGKQYEIVDIGMRMLNPRELFGAQGFPEDYVIDPDFNGRPLTKTKQTMCCGNSVSPYLAKALVEANFREELERIAA